MFTSDEGIAALRAALAISPENDVLRRHVAEVYAASGRTAEAIAEYRTLAGRGEPLVADRIGLARALWNAGGFEECAAIVEPFQDEPHPPAVALLLYARLKARAGDSAAALRAFNAAVAADAASADDAFAAELTRKVEAARPVPIPALHFDDEQREPDAVDAGTHAEVEKPSIAFADVGGMQPLKEQIAAKIIAPLLHPELYAAYGKSAGGGILMYGPPGVGKTYIARATAGEIKGAFISVGISDILDMYLGNSERNLKRYFKEARRHAPCVLFFDEVDALGGSRQHLRGSAAGPIINQFLAELDGVKDSNDGVLVLAATNAPWLMDSAFRRPGRFDRVLFVPPPDAIARAEILRVLCKGKPIRDIDFDAIAKKSDGFSGADLKAIVDIATERKLAEALAAGTLKPLETRDLVRSAGEVRPTVGEWFATARNYALYANNDGMYDDIAAYLKL